MAQNKITGMTNNSEEQQTSSSTEETIIEVVIQPPTTEAKVESDAPPAVITTQPAQPMPEHDDSIAVNQITEMTNNSEEQQTSSSTEETIIEVSIQPPTTEAKPAQPMPEHDDSIAVVMWEATVTGRRLIDEMVNLGSFYVAQEEKAEGHDFNEYVIPYGKLPLNTLERYRLLDDVNKILLGCVNGWDLLRQQVTTEIVTRELVHDLKDEHRMVLKALADHHLGVDTPLESAVQRDPHQLRSFARTTEQVKKIKEELTKEAQWRPVFADMFRQGIKPRRRAEFLRHMLVESGITYAGLTETFKDKKDDGVVEVIKENINGKNEADVEEFIKLLNQHLAQPDKPVRRGSGRRAPRTRSLCNATDLEKQQPASKSSPRKTTTTLSK
ncbi:hypothetical protein DAPPUDRAFT_229767 [Daphnia pulex]|uniref:Exuperantia SAM-like domain-containing protein n=1 Tax=Daphnia pulex TaxID=6669 RepID=E9HU85_DAPPU|nr:hypothetical protein DAPPUDRAFT_229767 [Daphnia pulex]|eukprot:EFX64705.1 hypothetical protein DAPPUDRAFT_229767 [Daphnia pulex]